MKKSILCLLLSLSALFSAQTSAETADAKSARKDFTVTVHTGAQQEFGGLGLHVGSNVDYKKRRTPIMDESGPGPYGNVPIEVRKEITKLLFGSGKFNWVRIWNICPEQMKDLKEAGVSNFMLTGTGTLDNQPLAENMAEQTLDIIKQGYPIKAVSYANKANANTGTACRRPLEGKQRGLPEGLKMLRAELDKQGLQAIPIVAPETCEWSPYREKGGGHDYKDKNPDKPTNGFVDGDNMRYMRSIADDPEALKALGIFSTQTYGQGVTLEEQAIAARHRKPYWVTMCWLNAKDRDPCFGPATAGAILSDLNHGVSVWFYWMQGYFWNLWKKNMKSAEDIELFPNYFFATAITESFQIGAVFRRSSLNPPQPTPDMHFNFERPHTIMSATARNPDGTWSVAILNLSGAFIQMGACKFDEAAGKTLTVAVNIEELKGAKPLVFKTRSVRGAAKEITPGQDVQMKQGACAVNVAPLEMIVMKSDAPAK